MTVASHAGPLPSEIVEERDPLLLGERRGTGAATVAETGRG